MAAPVENGSRFDDQAGRVNLSDNNSAGLELDFPLGIDDSIEAAADGDGIPVYCAFHRGVLAEDERPCRYKRPLDGSVETECSGHLEPTLEANAFFEKPCPFAGVLGFSIKPRKGHFSPPIYIVSFCYQLVVETRQITIVIVFKNKPTWMSSNAGRNRNAGTVNSLELLDGCFDIRVPLKGGALGFRLCEAAGQALDLANCHTAARDSAREFETLLRIGDGE